MYKNRFHYDRVSKNTGDRRSERKRARSAPVKKPLTVVGDVMSLEGFSIGTKLGEQLAPKRYKTQEEILVWVDNYLSGMFDPRNQGWTADVFGFINPKHNTANQMDTWQILSDRCYGVSVLIQSGSPGKARVSLDHFLEGLEQIAKYRDPSIVAKFWRICLQLRGVDGSYPRLQALKRFFMKLQELFLAYQGKQHPLTLLVRLLSQVSPEDFKGTLRIGYFKTLKRLSELIGDENATVLHMWSVYYKYWDKQYLQKETLFKKLKNVREQATKICERGSSSRIAMDHFFIYTCHYVCERVELTKSTAFDLIQSIKSTDILLHWNLSTQAFALASKLLAEDYRKRNCQEGCLLCMERTINILQDGDRECRIRAAMLSGTLSKWLTEWEMDQDAQWQRLRTALILETISGSCGRCRPNIICQKCAVRRGIKPRERKLHGSSEPSTQTDTTTGWFQHSNQS